MIALRRLRLALLLRLNGLPRLGAERLPAGLWAFLSGRFPEVPLGLPRLMSPPFLPLSSMPHLLSGIIITYFHYTSLIICLFQEILSTFGSLST